VVPAAVMCAATGVVDAALDRTAAQVERIARVAFDLARRRHLTIVHKANGGHGRTDRAGSRRHHGAGPPDPVVDGQDGVGQVLAAFAAREAVRRAREHGVGVVAVRNSNHFGTAAYFTRMAARDGCVAILTTNANSAMAPVGCPAEDRRHQRLVDRGTGRRDVMAMDIANTAVARGKVYLAKTARRGNPARLGNRQQRRTHPDPGPAIAGVILPMAGHNGYAISLMMDVLSGVLTGSSFGSAMNGPYQFDRRSG
jgi:LDH2 family malate/lactate/ureidoglycolate dehydrogenase